MSFDSRWVTKVGRFLGMRFDRLQGARTCFGKAELNSQIPSAWGHRASFFLGFFLKSPSPRSRSLILKMEHLPEVQERRLVIAIDYGTTFTG